MYFFRKQGTKIKNKMEVFRSDIRPISSGNTRITGILRLSSPGGKNRIASLVSLAPVEVKN